MATSEQGDLSYFENRYVHVRLIPRVHSLEKKKIERIPSAKKMRNVKKKRQFFNQLKPFTRSFTADLHKSFTGENTIRKMKRS